MKFNLHLAAPIRRPDLKPPSPAIGLLCVMFLCASPRGHAVTLYGTDDPAINTSPPAGDLAGSGWQFQGTWGGFLGTPIAPHHFITAGHVGGQIGDLFVFNGSQYRTTAMFDDPGSDLRIWRVCGSFPAFASLYTGGDEPGKRLVVFGRGTRRGEAVTGPGTGGDELKGWRWGAGDGQLRWGENVVTRIADGNAMAPWLSGSGIGDLLEAEFNAGAGPNEAHLSTGDSGGAVFLQENGTWKLAGINYAVTGPYNTTNSGPGFQATLFDQGGLYSGSSTNWTLTPDSTADKPGAFYATRISSNLPWIQSVLSQAGANDPSFSLESASQISGPFTAEPSASIHWETQTVTVTPTGDARYFRLRGCSSTRITGIHTSGESIVLTFTLAES